MSIRTERWRFIGDRTGWPTMARTAFWSSRHPALLRAPPPTTPGEAVTWRHGPHCNPLRNAMPGMAPVDLWTTPPGLLVPTVRQTGVAHNSTGASSAEGRGDIVFCRTGLVPDDTLPSWHSTPGVCTRGRTRTKRTDHELQKPDRLTS